MSLYDSSMLFGLLSNQSHLRYPCYALVNLLLYYTTLFLFVFLCFRCPLCNNVTLYAILLSSILST